ARCRCTRGSARRPQRAPASTSTPTARTLIASRLPSTKSSACSPAPPTNGQARKGTMDDLYRDEILEHYRNPHNFGTIDEPTAVKEGANPLCGDRITL